MKKIEVLGLQTIPEIKPDDNLPEIIVNCAETEVGGIHNADIVVVTSKIVSKAMGLMKSKSDVKPSKKALDISKRTGKDPIWVQMIMDAGHEVVAVIPLDGMFRNHVMCCSEDIERSTRMCDSEQCVFVTVSASGTVHTCDAGIDGSNHPDDIVSFMPPAPDEVAEAIRREIKAMTSKEAACIIADTEIMPFGTMDLAIGSAGIEPRSREFGKVDNFGKPKFGGMDLTAYELTAAAALVFGQVNAGIPAAIIRGFDYTVSDTANIANTFRPQDSSRDVRRAIREIIKATANAKNFKRRLLLRVASWFV